MGETSHRRWAVLGGMCAVAALVAGCGSSGSTASSSGPAAPASQDQFVSAIKQVLPSVVEIRTSTGLGSGVIFDSAGDIVTNAHVVGSGSGLMVYLATSAQPLPASLTGVYAPDDLAVIKVSGAKNPRPASFGNSAGLQAGDVVLAVGNPLGLSSSVTEGIVSAVGRIVSEPTTAGAPGATLPDTIQTSAAINPGNSGGALATLDGKVVGIPTLAATNQEAGGAAAGIGFAIPSSTVVSIARQLIGSGRVTDPHRAALGITAATIVGPEGTAAGVSVVSVTEGGAAAQAGLTAGDVITAVDGKPTPDSQALSATLASLSPGQTVPVSIAQAGGGTASVRVTLGELPGNS